jgi:Mor family transcriptional regulator
MAARRLLRLLYPNPKPESPQGIFDARNEEIRRRYKAGERVVDLAQEYGMTIQGIYRILRAGKH